MKGDIEAIDVALEKLHSLKGKEYLIKLKEITELKVFEELTGHNDIYCADGTNGILLKKNEEHNNLLHAAYKATTFGYSVYILPNPGRMKTGDFILRRNNYCRLYELKTIYGQNSIGNRLHESVDQSNSVLLNIISSIKPRVVAKAVKQYFEYNKKADEVLIFKGKRRIIVKELDMKGDFVKKFISEWNKNK